MYPFPQRWSPDDLGRFESTAGSPLGAARRVSLSVTVRGPAMPSASCYWYSASYPPASGMAPREKDLNGFCARSIDQLPQQTSSRLFLWGAPFFHMRFCESQFVCRWPTRDLYCGATQNFDLRFVWGASFPPQHFRVQFPCCGSKASRFPPQAFQEKGNGKKSCSQQGNSYTNRFAISSPPFGTVTS